MCGGVALALDTQSAAALRSLLVSHHRRAPQRTSGSHVATAAAAKPSDSLAPFSDLATFSARHTNSSVCAAGFTHSPCLLSSTNTLSLTQSPAALRVMLLAGDLVVP